MTYPVRQSTYIYILASIALVDKKVEKGLELKGLNFWTIVLVFELCYA